MKNTAGSAAHRKRSAASMNGGTVSSAQRIGHEREAPDRHDEDDEDEIAKGESDRQDGRAKGRRTRFGTHDGKRRFYRRQAPVPRPSCDAK